MIPTEEINQIRDMIRQVAELMAFSGDMPEELSEAQMDLIVAGVSAPEYQQFIQNIQKKRRGEHGSETDR